MSNHQQHVSAIKAIFWLSIYSQLEIYVTMSWMLWTRSHLHLDVRQDIEHNVHGSVIYISYYEHVISLKMAFIAETWCWWLLI